MTTGKEQRDTSSVVTPAQAGVHVPILQIQDLDIRFRIDRKSEPFQAVKGISFDVPTNSTVALVGESGSGKTVSAMAILRLLPDNAIVAPQGSVLYAGRDL